MILINEFLKTINKSFKQTIKSFKKTTNTVMIKDVGAVTIPERNTAEEIIHIVNSLKDDPETLHEMLLIEPEPFWCEHDACLEVIEPYNSEQELAEHICKCHLNECN